MQAVKEKVSSGMASQLSFKKEIRDWRLGLHEFILNTTAPALPRSHHDVSESETFKEREDLSNVQHCNFIEVEVLLYRILLYSIRRQGLQSRDLGPPACHGKKGRCCVPPVVFFRVEDPGPCAASCSLCLTSFPYGFDGEVGSKHIDSSQSASIIDRGSFTADSFFSLNKGGNLSKS
eukprot:1162079-Pelagomonas_calceolata.AAC.1